MEEKCCAIVERVEWNNKHARSRQDLWLRAAMYVHSLSPLLVQIFLSPVMVLVLSLIHI